MKSDLNACLELYEMRVYRVGIISRTVLDQGLSAKFRYHFGILLQVFLGIYMV